MRVKNGKLGTVAFVALGCPKNIVDSERMLAEIAQAGYLIAAEPDEADVIVINTCGFIAPAKAEALREIERAVELKRNGAVKKVVVAGCLPERLGSGLFRQAEGIDAIVGLGERERIARIIERTLLSEEPAAYLGHSRQKAGQEPRKGAKRSLAAPDDRVRLRITPAHWAYLRISEGCDHRCSFCTIPAIRGPFRSKPRQLVLAEAAELVLAGAVELNIIGQDITHYGHDMKIDDALPTLLDELDRIPGLAWIRLLYAYPRGVGERLIETIAGGEKVLPYIDMPIQHINNEILRHMRRPDSKDRICGLIEALRGAIPDIVLRTTVIVGFPGETDGHFNELLEFVKWAQFDALGCFKFYPEFGTAAAEMPGQIAEEVKEQRLEQLMLTQQRIVFDKNRERIGSLLTCLVDSVDSRGGGRGRFYGQAPDIDSICIMEKCSAAPGRLVNTRVVGTKDYDLLVEQI